MDAADWLGADHAAPVVADLAEALAFEQPLEEGGEFDLTLEFEKAGKVPDFDPDGDPITYSVAPLPLPSTVLFPSALTRPPMST